MRYTTITGREIDVGALSDPERGFLEEIAAIFRAQPDWTRFAAQWMRLGRERLWRTTRPVGTPLYAVCQDLETRLGVAQGKVSAPDYRDLLLDIIDERFPSRAAFCRSAGMDPGHLSRVLAGKSEISVETLHRALAVVGVVLTARPMATTEEPSSQLRQLLDRGDGVRSADLLDALEERRGNLRNLHELARHMTGAERARLVEGSLFQDERFAPLATRIRARPENALEAIRDELERADAVIADIARESERLHRSPAQQGATRAKSA